MKKMAYVRYWILTIMVIATLVLFVSCKNKPETNDQQNAGKKIDSVVNDSDEEMDTETEYENDTEEEDSEGLDDYETIYGKEDIEECRQRCKDQCKDDFEECMDAGEFRIYDKFCFETIFEQCLENCNEASQPCAVY